MHERLVNSSSVSGNNGFSDRNSSNRGSIEKRFDPKKSKRPQGSSFNTTNESTKLNSKFPIDNDNHPIWKFEKFKTMSVDERSTAVKEKN